MTSIKYIFIFLGLVLLSCNSQTENREKWIQQNSHGLSLSDTSNYQDLKFLDELLKDKRIVLLGESGHGVAEYTLLKSRIIRYLHENLDFDVVAFEANSADAFAADYFNPYTNVDSTIYNSISTLWHVEEIVPLFRYINASHNTDNPISVQGVDMTQSNASFAFSEFLFKLIYQIDAQYAIDMKSRDSLFSALGVARWTNGHIYTDNQNKEFRDAKKEMYEDYTRLKKFIQENKDMIKETNGYESEAALFYVQSRIDFIHWIDRDSSYMAKVAEGTRYEGVLLPKLFSVYRDYKMAENLRFLSEVIFPDKKLIVWAQNAHIKKYPKRMASELAILHPTYTISLHSYSGKGDHTFGQGFDGSHPDSAIYQFQTPTDPLSVAQLLHPSGHNITFVDMLNQTESKGNSWMFKIAKTHDWNGDGLSELENIRSIWDALILVNETTTPEYLEFDYPYFGNHVKGYNKR